MTIKIEREALLTVLSRAPQQPPLHLESASEDEFVLVSLPKSSDDLVQFERSSTYDDDDCCTVVSASTSSSTSSSSASPIEPTRSVSFAEPLVTDVRTRPRTPKSQVARLFYSVEETTRFRQEYRLERRLLAELDVDAETQAANEEEISSLFETTEPQGRHSISRVVVLHNDKIETFCGPQPCTAPPSSFPPALECPATASGSDDFFDNDSFWSGSITWY